MASLRLRWWLTVISCLGALVAAQAYSAYHVKTRTGELQSYLDQAYSLSLGLTRSIGYGGLIHNLKNQVLRPDNPDYSRQAHENARTALHLLQGLERSAQAIGVTGKLDATRTMISAYSVRLKQLPELVAQGLSPVEVDARIRFYDGDAIREIDALLLDLKRAVSREVNSVGLQGSALYWSSSAATMLMILVLLVQRARRIRDLKFINALNGKLSETVRNLGEANTSIKQFTGLVSHDLKAPLRHIGFFGARITEDIDNSEDVRKHLGSISKSIARMNRMIESLLDFTKTGFTEPNLTQVPVKEVAVKALSELERSIREKSAKITLELSGLVMADAALLCRVFENLIANSLKYSRNGVPPHIELKSWSVAPAWCFEYETSSMSKNDNRSWRRKRPN